MLNQTSGGKAVQIKELKLHRLLLPLCLLYATFLFVSYVSSRYIPRPFDLTMPEDIQKQSCYMYLYGVKCGSDVFAGPLREWFFNIWIVAWYVPALAAYGWYLVVFIPENLDELGLKPFTNLSLLTLQSLALVAPILYLIWHLLKRSMGFVFSHHDS
ncbi:hypothetical protein [Cohaesibacter celericrescens]|uniref:Uncharacterized protein n=1 Tax=Cohaesibacter celericrescens TaxID=2067669 RepID=A0A2N5XV79_9HYPH|nr:hypothetical protein [Cohaesibacter celericrescens]PLW78367.1 hypothetical protein C0081_04540 [Cohaesibacter celericrescens]